MATVKVLYAICPVTVSEEFLINGLNIFSKIVNLKLEHLHR